MTKDERKKGLSFAARLKQLLMEAPDEYSRRDINRMVASMHHRYGLTREEKKAVVLRAIENGAATVKEIEEETGIIFREVHICVRDLEREGTVRREKTNFSNTGRPSHYFFVNNFSPQTTNTARHRLNYAV